MLHESQEEVKLLRSRASSAACLCHPQSRGAFPVVTSTRSMAHTAGSEQPQEHNSLCCSHSYFVVGKGADLLVFQFFNLYTCEKFRKLVRKLTVHLIYFDAAIIFPFYMPFLFNKGIGMLYSLCSVVLVSLLDVGVNFVTQQCKKHSISRTQNIWEFFRFWLVALCAQNHSCTLVRSALKTVA